MAKGKKVSEMTEDELRKVITDAIELPIMALASGIRDIKKAISTSSESKSHP